MTQALPAVRLNPPSRFVLKFFNPLLGRVLSSRWGERINEMLLLRFQGRRSGRIIKTPVSYHEIDGVITLFTDRPWRLNFAGGAPVMVIHRGRVRRGRAELLKSSPEAVGAAIRGCLDNGDLPRSFGMVVAPGHTPTVAELAALGHSMIRLDLDN